MERARSSFIGRRRLLQGAALAAMPTALMTASPAKALQAVDYPAAASFPASTSNYTASNRPTTYTIDYVVIHVTQEYWSDAIAIFQDPSAQVSAHYVVRSKDGHIAQCVREHDVAWHAGNWDYNTHSIGIEHEGWVDQPQYFTDALYESSAKVTASVCARYGIPISTTHIIGHSDVPGATHTDPGPYWDWARYINLVNQAALGWF
jgi:N-acetyl-anhydromuramyl-L-alanine amidase AmpD